MQIVLSCFNIFKHQTAQSIRYKGAFCAVENSQNAFPSGALPRTTLGELTTLPDPRSRQGRVHPSPYPTLGARHASSIIPARSTAICLVSNHHVSHYTAVQTNSVKQNVKTVPQNVKLSHTWCHRNVSKVIDTHRLIC